MSLYADELKRIENLPRAWKLGILTAIIADCKKRNLFKSDAALKEFVKRVIDDPDEADAMRWLPYLR